MPDMNTILCKTIRFALCTVVIVLGLAASMVLATVILEPSLTLGKVESWLAGNMPMSVIVLTNQGLGTNLCHGALLLATAGAMAFLAMDNRRIAADRETAGL